MTSKALVTSLSTVCVALVGICAALSSTDVVSADYRVVWDVVDNGGGRLSTDQYVITDSIGQSSAIGASFGTNYTVLPGFEAPPDSDEDVVKDFLDNCTLEKNTDQRDTNSDRIGNACDADITNDCAVNFGDLAELKAAFVPGPYDPDADFNGDGFVNFGDLAFMKSTFFNGANPGPGPSGLPSDCD